MSVYIAKDHNNTTISVVFATSRELAVAYWHGKDIVPHQIINRTYSDLVNHPTGVIPIINTEEKRLYVYGNFKKLRVII